MPAKTEKYLPDGTLPARGFDGQRVDFTEYADALDVSALPQESIDILDKRYPATLFAKPMQDEVDFAEFCAMEQRRTLQAAQAAFDDAFAEAEKRAAGGTFTARDETTIRKKYNLCFQALTKYIGETCHAYHLKMQLEAMTEDDKAQEQERINREMKEYEERLGSDDFWHEDEHPYADKLKKIRRAVGENEGRKVIPQREYAKIIGYPVNKYAKWEKGDAEADGESVDPKLLFILISQMHVNPKWLMDDDVEQSAVNEVWDGHRYVDYSYNRLSEGVPLFWRVDAIKDWLRMYSRIYEFEQYM